MDIPGPIENDGYDGPQDLRPNVSRGIYTVLQCRFEIKAVDKFVFLQICGE